MVDSYRTALKSVEEGVNLEGSGDACSDAKDSCANTYAWFRGPLGSFGASSSAFVVLIIKIPIRA
ncbi:hypothetical protein AOQ84DRAFT_352592 [Glonium stellatum]|uniref:Uncharacterized protein n=1 Tax=Glonium stellatum TaxID=574774 RepID=A0A8E2JX22_9PEZI|nr:hypothetical protein AOQ84DRAFT_352592 [Glonium stellatum]